MISDYFKKLSLKKKVKLLILFLLLIIYWQILPSKLFDVSYCTVITDRNGELLGAHIAEDGQYRFPEIKKVPEKFKKAITVFEDKRFYSHWGFDPLAFLRAVKQNISSGKIVSGGSTLTMQVIRLSRNRDRTVAEKIIEIILATRLEFSYSKEEILAMYASHAPFGGNVVGLDAAAWRYFGRTPDKLTWAETAMLAVLPNSPALIHPGKNRTLLFEKRNRLLKNLLDEKIINQETYELSIDEPIPEKPKEFPNEAPHLLFRIQSEKENEAVTKSTINISFQAKLNEIIERNHSDLAINGINNIAAIVIDVKTAEVLAYTGNVRDLSDNKNGNFVDIIPSVRSTGSVLKPFLYASMLSSGEILPDALVLDVPIRLGGYVPKNYSRGYDGVVPAKKALARSLNIPAVKMLQQYKVERFYNKLKQIGITSLTRPPMQYGLSLILGGCEGSLWEISGIYASMARTLLNYKKNGNKYNPSDYKAPEIYYSEKKNDVEIQLDKNSFFTASAIWLTFEAMLDVERPNDENNWEAYESSERIAWKTGTSFGFRDAWAIGITPKYVVGVWAGNADGEGRPDLIGIKAAAPILFEIFNFLPDANGWFEKPFRDMMQTEICSESGYLVGAACPHPVKKWVPKSANRFSVCPYHKIIHLDKTGKYRVSSDCEAVEDMTSEPWFVLPPAAEAYYKKKKPTYKYLPPYRSDCRGNNNSDQNIELIYPFHNSKIFVPIELDETKGRTVFEAAHRDNDMTVFWYIDDKLVGKTTYIHSIEVNPGPGKHILTLIDEKGEKISREFEIVNKEE